MKVSFFYNAQLHQVPHSLPIALELAAHHPDIEVEIAAPSERHLSFARRLAERYDRTAPVQFIKLPQTWWTRANAALTGALAPGKKSTLWANVAYFSSCDAVVVPEHTTLALRRYGLRADTRIICTNHGAGDRDIDVAPKIRDFDFVVNPGTKTQERRLALGLIRPGAYVTGVYAKFDWYYKAQDVPRQPLFDNGRATVLYNPHFEPGLSSWPAIGWRVLDAFAASKRYNLVFAPHVRLFEPVRRHKLRPFDEYAKLSHVRIDLGSERSIDMTYTLGADAYLGDVSSQVAELLMRPRPCLFLNPRGIRWQDDPNFRFWNLGPVLEDVAGLDEALAHAFSSHADYAKAQYEYFEDSFDGAGRAPTARRGADAIAAYLGNTLTPGATPGAASGAAGSMRQRR